MFEQEEGVADLPGLACGDDLLLEGEAFCVGDAAEMEEVDVHGLFVERESID